MTDIVENLKKGQSLTFEELRARLPNTITDDIVTLIASSEQALADFANIQTQQHIQAQRHT